ncbi:MAG: hypothetical protein V7782_00850 [Psychromonas sp.]
MNAIVDTIKQLIVQNRSEWIGLITYRYAIGGDHVLKYYGYISQEHYKQDLIKHNKTAKKNFL